MGYGYFTILYFYVYEENGYKLINEFPLLSIR